MTIEETTLTFTELTADLEISGGRLAAHGGGLPDLSALVRRLQRRRHRRPARHHPPAAALAELGIDAIWLSPFYKSPQADAGYDVADYRDVDPVFGTLADFDAMLDRAHGLGLKVIVDLVPNHSSDEHEWFRQALAAAPGSPERERYMFRDGRGENGELPPNNWESCFRGPAWTRTTDADGTPGQWYLHLFDTKQPDWNWENPEVRAEFLTCCGSGWTAGRRVPGGRGPRADQGPGLPDRNAAEKAADASTPRASSTSARCGTRTGCTRCTGSGARCWTPTPPTGSCAPRRGCRHWTGWPATSATTRCTRRSTSTTWRANGTPRPARG